MNYHWQTNSGTPGSGGEPELQRRLRQLYDAGQSRERHADYHGQLRLQRGGETAEAIHRKAAAWVSYAKSKNYGVRFWEIGNEVYGNGEYGNDWEEDLHSDHSPTAYGTNALSFISAMKAQDSSIKVGVVLTCPGSFPDGQSPDWNSNVLEQCGSKIEFRDYPLVSTESWAAKVIRDCSRSRCRSRQSCRR